jgi:uncharacterized SAM-binding protein YcdF (DUF218 family)
MAAAYKLIKASLDPVVFILILIAIGFFVSFKKGNKQPVRMVLLLAFFFLYTASIFPVSNALCYIIEKDYLLRKSGDIGKFDIVIVLGGGVSDNKYLQDTLPSYQTTSRLSYAVQMFRETSAKFMVCAGKGDEKLSEAEVMKTAAERLGVSADKIKIDAKSRNTREHAEELNKMFDDKNLKIGVVTSAYHMKRSEREFKKYFHNVIPLPSDYLYSSPPSSIIAFIPRSGNFYKFSTALHEMIGIVWYRIKK